jgi:hypothetical protein
MVKTIEIEGHELGVKQHTKEKLQEENNPIN